ncbi:hypothetical protein [Rariglobus hedericola]|uniref:Uncharacterized protein n=1 Tax=Rariglobus hedericola TaxID=2597822 RepID=A0A556QJB5_9BACT|nr:hypothetical protein [Rariglobus hedericola]TSJ76744.1 hypothetical protein FPL22_11505 [Rariglobus hedericola]
MAVFIKATYSKKLGLPQYSSHQYTVEVSSELTDVSQLPQASADLYARLQQAVDGQIVNPGFVPGETAPPASPSATSPITSPTAPAPRGEDSWKCSDKQRDLILKIVDEHGLDKAEIEKLAQERYGTGVKQLNKLQASGLIDELLETHGKTEAPRRGNFRQPAYGRNRR